MNTLINKLNIIEMGSETHEPVSRPNYHLLSLNELALRKETVIMTAKEASKFIFNVTCFEIPVLHFIRICYIALTKIDLNEETVLVNLIFTKLKKKGILDVEINQPVKMTDLMDMLIESFLPSLNVEDCQNKLKVMKPEEYDNLYDYINIFNKLYILILHHKIKTLQHYYNIKCIVKHVECKYMQYFFNGLDVTHRYTISGNFTSSALNQHMIETLLLFGDFENSATYINKEYEINANVKICFCAKCLKYRGYDKQREFNFNQDKNNLSTTSSDIPTDELEEEEDQRNLFVTLRLTAHASSSYIISSIVVDKHTRQTGIMTAKEASKVIPYFNGVTSSFYDFLKACYIALSNILIDEEPELLGITLSRLKGRAAICVRWVTILRMKDLLSILSKQFDYADCWHTEYTMNNIQMNFETCIYKYVAEFSELHVKILCQKLKRNSHKPIKEIISFVEAQHIMQFKRGFTNIGYSPKFSCNGFHNFLENVILDYLNFKHEEREERRNVKKLKIE